MPRITWNAEIRSVRPLRDLATIRLLNYKEVMASTDLQYIKMQLDWRPQMSMNPYRTREEA